MWRLDLRSLALLRICYGGLLIQDLAIRATDLGAHYTDFGVAPRATVLELDNHFAYWSLHMLNGTWTFALIMFVIAAFCSLCMLVGYRTRLATFLSWMLLVSMHTRNPVVLDGGDVYLRCVFFWGRFLPWGQRWSIDALRRRGAPPPTNDSFTLGGVGYVLQLSLVYWVAAALKTGVEWRVEGSAVYYALSLEQLTTPLAPWLLAQPALMRFLSFGTLYFEALGPFFLWLPGWFRMVGILGLSAMHLGFGLFMHLGVFALIGASSAFGTLPGAFWDRLERTGWWPKLHAAVRRAAGRWPLPGGGALAPQPSSVGYDAICISLMGYVVLWNLTTIPGIRLPFNFPDAVGRFLRIDQRWNMFAPKPLVEDGWFVIEADRMDGAKIDLFQDGAPLTWDKPQRVASTYKNARWRKFIMNLWVLELSAWRLPYGQYLTRWWNGSHEGNMRVKTFKIWYMLEVTRPPSVGGTMPLQKQLLWSHQCFEEPAKKVDTTGPAASSTPGASATPARREARATPEPGAATPIQVALPGLGVPGAGTPVVASATPGP